MTTTSNSHSLCACHPERSLAESEANCQTQSKDPVPAATSTGAAGNFRIVIRFFDEHEAECHHECSPRRKPWGELHETQK